ncbi:MAG TPA: CoA-binding protein [Bacteroidia bacterium]|nr:CoA-binding protein [Bacteroidia bacterium]
MTKTTLVLGASDKPSRYSFLAARNLKKHGHNIILLGIRAGQVEDETIRTDRPVLADVDTVTLYINPTHQKDWYDYILNLNPRRIIFNPGTENPEFVRLAKEKGIDCVEACTLVMLSIGNY